MGRLRFRYLRTLRSLFDPRRRDRFADPGVHQRRPGAEFGRSGDTLYFRRHRNVLRVGVEDGRPVGEAVDVFDAPNLATADSYDISADETRMVALQLDDDAIPTELRVVTNFFEVIRAACEPNQP